MRFVAGVVVGTLFGRTIIRATTRVVPKSIRDKAFDKFEEKATTFVQNRVEGAMNFAERKLYGQTREEFRAESGPYRRFRR
ncbi:hypothetical protein SEA_MADAMATO_56 [Streptomyces phage Madamato]|nr:hypothetical protein SEA_MADAMATO_56 [Streptomyces phage Madamato]